MRPPIAGISAIAKRSEVCVLQPVIGGSLGAGLGGARLGMIETRSTGRERANQVVPIRQGFQRTGKWGRMRTATRSEMCARSRWSGTLRRRDSGTRHMGCPTERILSRAALFGDRFGCARYQAQVIAVEACCGGLVPFGENRARHHPGPRGAGLRTVRMRPSGVGSRQGCRLVSC